MTDFLLPIEDKHSINPIILVDVSGSTNSKLSNQRTIREYEFEITKLLLEKYGQAQIICWSNEAFSLGTLKHGDLEVMTEIYEKCKKISNVTHLMSGLSLIDTSLFVD